VHGKGSLLGKMPGDRWQRFANLRAYLGFMGASWQEAFVHGPCEIGQERRMGITDAEIDWPLLGDPMQCRWQRLVGDLNRLYAGSRRCNQRDALASGFRWLIAMTAPIRVFASCAS